jgi:hypothetical protein
MCDWVSKLDAEKWSWSCTTLFCPWFLHCYSTLRDPLSCLSPVALSVIFVMHNQFHSRAESESWLRLCAFC